MLQQGLTRGPLESASQSKEKQAGIDHGHGAESGQQRHSGSEREHLGEDHGAATVVAVSDMSGDQGEEEKRRDLHEADVAENEARSVSGCTDPN